MGSGENAAHYRLICPRCSGDISYYENAGAVACPFCRAQFFLGADTAAGWLLVPRIQPLDAVQEAKRWLREHRQRITRIDEPRGFLLPTYWVRGQHISWEVGEAFRPGSIEESPLTSPLSSDRTPSSDVWEPRFQIRAYSHSFPAHYLAEVIPGAATRFQAQTLTLLDPDRLPENYRIVAPTVSRTEAETMLASWLEGRLRIKTGREGKRRATRSAEHRLSMAGIPMVVVPFAFRDDRGGVLVDGLSGKALRTVTGEMLEDLPWDQSEHELPSSFSHGEVTLLPLECAECGWELELSERDHLHLCPNCGLCWEMVGSERRRVRQWFLDRTASRHDRWLPFWVFGPGSSEERLPAEPVFLPAYRARHREAQLHLSVTLTRTPPVGPWLSHSLDIHTGATIGSGETEAWRWALEGARSRTTFADFMQFLRADPVSMSWERPVGLGWIPFEPRGGDLVEPQTGARVREAGTLGWRDRRAA